jgi:hypothetical protein
MMRRVARRAARASCPHLPVSRPAPSPPPAAGRGGAQVRGPISEVRVCEPPRLSFRIDKSDARPGGGRPAGPRLSMPVGEGERPRPQAAWAHRRARWKSRRGRRTGEADRNRRSARKPARDRESATAWPRRSSGAYVFTPVAPDNLDGVRTRCMRASPTGRPVRPGRGVVFERRVGGLPSRRGPTPAGTRRLRRRAGNGTRRCR